MHALPGPFCGVAGEGWTQDSISILRNRGYRNENIFQMKYDDLKIFAEEGGVILTLHSLSGHGIKTFVLPHGIDEDIIYMSKDGTFEFSKESEYNTETFVFSRFNKLKNGFQAGTEMRQFLDGQRKTVVYVGTIGNWEFLDFKSPVAQKTLEQLMNLKKKYNVILRLHPQLDPQMTKKLKVHFTDIDFSSSPSLLPLYDLADVVIGAPGGAITSATFKAEIPLVLLRPTQWWSVLAPTFTMDDVAEKNKGFVLGPETAIHQNEHTLSLEKAVEEALNDPNHIAKIEKRKEYFKNWFGCIDGYEEYRVVIKVFEHKNIDVLSLKRLYNLFQRYENRPVCRYEGV